MRVVFFLSLLAVASAVGPIQKVLSLLGDLRSKVQAEGEVEAEQFDKYTKWATAEKTDRAHAIETGKGKAADLTAEIQELNADINKLTGDVATLAASINQNDGDLQKATKIRGDEHAEFLNAQTDLVETVDTLIRAASVLRKSGLKGSAGSAAQMKAAFAQVDFALSTVMDAAVINVNDKQRLSSLLEAAQEDGPSGAPEAAAYESHSTGILDMLAELKVKAESELAELRKNEMNSKHSFEMLSQSLNDQIKTENRDKKNAEASSSSKQEAKGIAEGDLDSTSKDLASDKKYLSDTEQAFDAKKNEFEMRKSSRVDELAALDKAIEILSGDKFTAAAGRRLPSLLQISARRESIEVRQKIAALLQSVSKKSNSVELAQLAMRMRVGDDPFGKVRGLISGMVEKLQKEAAEEQSHKAYCDSEKSESNAKREKFSNKVDNLSARVDKAVAGVTTLKEEIATLSKEVANADKSMAEATQLRNREHSEYEAAIADYEESSNAIAAAISVLQEHYASNPALLQGDFGAPIFEGDYQKKSDSASGIIGLLEVSASDFARMEAEARAAESADAKSFTKMKNENEVNRAMKTTAVKSKNSEVNRVNNLINDLQADRNGAQQELDAVLAYLGKLKESCEFKPMPFEERAARRQAEIAGLKNALEILDVEGGAPAFLQRL